MTETHLQIKRWYDEYLREYEKFHAGKNAAAGIRAGKALQKLIECADTRQTELTEERKSRRGK